MPDHNHDRLNAAVAAHLPVAMEAQEELARVVDLNSPYQADIAAGLLTIGGRPLRVVLLGTVSKSTNTWLWSWANVSFSPDVPSIAPVRRLVEVADSWDLWQFGEPQFSVDGVTAFYSADYGGGWAYFGVTDPAVPRPSAGAVTFPRRILDAATVLPGYARSQVLTYASVHNLRVVGDERQLKVHLGSDVLAVDFDDEGRIVSIRGTLGAHAL
jgi:hypothetical protein